MQSQGLYRRGPAVVRAASVPPERLPLVLVRAPDVRSLLRPWLGAHATGHAGAYGWTGQQRVGYRGETKRIRTGSLRTRNQSLDDFGY